MIDERALGVVVASILAAAAGCSIGPPKPSGLIDDEAAQGESEGPIEDLPSTSTTTDSTSDCEPDVSGVYLFALEASLGPGLPLEFVLTIDATHAGDCSATAALSFQPLSLDVGSQTSPREFVGDPLLFQDVAFDAQGEFVIDMGVVEVSGAANPITGSDLPASLILDGHVVDVDALCGEVTGALLSPLEYDLAGSTFAAIQLADDGSNPDTLPMTFPYNCSQVPPP